MGLLGEGSTGLLGGVTLGAVGFSVGFSVGFAVGDFDTCFVGGGVRTRGVEGGELGAFDDAAEGLLLGCNEDGALGRLVIVGDRRRREGRWRRGR